METLNKMVIYGVSKPEICGVLCEGENVYTYIMDLPFPKLNRTHQCFKDSRVWTKFRFFPV
jgi:hypothetical protein